MERIKFFNKTKSKMNLQEKFDYIKNHFYYYTMNSWNELKSLANNVKVYNLPLTEEQKNRFFELYCDEGLSYDLFCNINFLIEEHNRENQLFNVFFNGRSDGYIVLYNKTNNNNVIDEDLIESNSKEDLIDYYKNYKGWTARDSRAEAKSQIEKNFEIVKEFDEFCDDLLNELIFVLENGQIEEEDVVVTKKIKRLTY